MALPSLDGHVGFSLNGISLGLAREFLEKIYGIQLE